MVLETVIWGGTLTPRVRACIGMVRSTKQSFPTRDRDRRSGPRPGTIVASAPCGRTNRGAHHPRAARQTPPREHLRAGFTAGVRSVSADRPVLRIRSATHRPPTGPRGRARAGAGADRAVDRTADTSRTPLHSAERTRQSATARTRGRAARAWSPPGPGPGPPRAAAGPWAPARARPTGYGARAPGASSTTGHVTTMLYSNVVYDDSCICPIAS